RMPIFIRRSDLGLHHSPHIRKYFWYHPGQSNWNIQPLPIIFSGQTMKRKYIRTWAELKIFKMIKAAFFSTLIFFCISVSSQSIQPKPKSKPAAIIIPGAWRMDNYIDALRHKSVAIFANQTSLLGKTHLVDTLVKLGIQIKKIFAPEHGFRGEADAGENVNNLTDPSTGIPIVSLYGNKIMPSPDDLRAIDIMVFDIQDVGARFYTYISSLQKYLEAAILNDKPLILLDRPNPNGFYVDGPVLDTGFKSFVGMQPIPVVYGMTLGEYASMLLGEKWLASPAPETKPVILTKEGLPAAQNMFAHFRLFIVANGNYSHLSKYQLPVKPSPNLPDMQAIYLYPSICFFEGTVVSLGRGTDKPFQQFGHPAFPKNLYHFTPASLPGAKTPPMMGKTCFGFDLSKINVQVEGGNQVQLKWLIKAYQLYPEKNNFFLASKFFNKLAGNDNLMQQIKDGKSMSEIRKSWQPALDKFKKTRKKYLLYPDFE
ncbi:MAG: exo-beta-N-acetylmuramidase NamZ domain-containing protein, partial [Chitinophagales bacterium]